jgi:hypothetical protein
VIKTNIIRSETRRIIRNCKNRKDAWSDLETLKNNFVEKSGYPEKLVTTHMMLQAVEKMKSNSSSLASNDPNPLLTMCSKSPSSTRHFPEKSDLQSRMQESTPEP